MLSFDIHAIQKMAKIADLIADFCFHGLGLNDTVNATLTIAESAG